MTEQKRPSTQQNENEVRERLEFIRRFHGDIDEDPNYCPGVKNCDHVNCEICRANKRQLDSTDTFRHGTSKKPTAYYSKSIVEGADGKLHSLPND